MKYFLVLLVLAFSSYCFGGPANCVSFRNDYTGVNVTTSVPLSVIATTANRISSASVFDSSGQTMKLLITCGGATSTLILQPGGGDYPVSINNACQIQLEAVSGTANTGEIDIVFFY